ncbi:hypothetical protein B0H13DRAFT_1917304 [Mycena leptocephala]|nr:hypothetical protein B0H13DRAFT_1917304 [Mycena leptocephala]
MASFGAAVAPTSACLHSPTFHQSEFRIHRDPTPPKHAPGSFQYDLASGKYQTQWKDWHELQTWLDDEQECRGKFRLVNTYKRSELYTRQLRYVCARTGTGGEKDYIKIHPDWNRKRGPKQTDCECTLLVKQFNYKFGIVRLKCWAADSYIPASLHYLLYVDGSSNIGLTGGSLYDVPETNAAIGTITVSAMGFNITCEFLEDLTADFRKEDSRWNVSSGGIFVGLLQSTQPRVISAFPANAENAFYSTISVIDSDNRTGVCLPSKSSDVFSHWLSKLSTWMRSPTWW